MTIFRRQLTFMTAIGAIMVAIAVSIFAFDFHVQRRDQDALAFIASAVAVKKGDDLANLEGRLVYAVGRPQPSRQMSDPDMGIVFDALAISREGEIYQWTQRGGKNPKYRAEWSDAALDSRSFKRPEGHQNKGAVEFASYADRSEGVTVDGVAVDPAFLASEKSRLVHVTEDMLSNVRPGIRKRYVLDRGRLVEGGPVASGKSDPLRIGTNRVTFRAVMPREGIVVGFMHDGRIVPGDTEIYGAVGAYIPGASDLPRSILGIDESHEQGHVLRLLSALAVAALAGGIVFRDFATANVVEKPLKFGR
ncbi:hypothetical protein G6L37_05775 [Agrobacterium rubi]|nr:hypothetical protein [Agrobacterium rubi]NTF24868.1 hypothetical protein [Agrobacterium rubi]